MQNIIQRQKLEQVHTEKELSPTYGKPIVPQTASQYTHATSLQ